MSTATGKPPGEERREVLLGVVARPGLMQACEEGPAFTPLAQDAADALPEALQLQREALLVGPGGDPDKPAS